MFSQNRDPKRGAGRAEQSEPNTSKATLGPRQVSLVLRVAFGQSRQAMTQARPIYPHQGQILADAVLPFGTRPVQDWLALSGKGLVDIWANPFQSLTKGTFVAELRLPLPKGKVLLQWHSRRGIEVGFSLFSGPNGQLSLLQRSGEHVLRMTLPAPAFGDARLLRISLRFDAGAKQWRACMQPLDGEMPAVDVAGVGGLALAHQDIGALCKDAALDPAILWYGFCHQAQLPHSAPWIGLRTPIDTAKGTLAAGNLRAGDMILTRDLGPIPLRALHRVDLPARGSFAPVLLRGPFYHKDCDILVAADQQIELTGSAVEYLFGTESVLVAARDVVDGQTALAEDRRHVISAVMLDLGGPALIGAAGGPGLALGDTGQTGRAPLPCLNSFETVTLMRMLGRIVSKVA